MGIFSRRKSISREQFPDVIRTLAGSFESLREEYVVGSHMQLKREGVDVSRMPRKIHPGSELDDMLRGYQLTSMIGIAWDYIRDAKAELDFDNMLSQRMNAQEGSRAWKYREKYIDCQGVVDILSSTLAGDIHRVIGSPDPRQRYILQFQGGAHILIWLCQSETCKACGDEKLGQQIRKKAIAMIG